MPVNARLVLLFAAIPTPMRFASFHWASDVIAT